MEGSPPRPASPSGLELRVERERAVVRFAPETIAPGVRLEQLSVEVPRPGSHVDVGAGPSQFRHLLCDLDALELEVSAAALQALHARIPLAEVGLADAESAVGAGFVELGGRVGSATRFTCRLAAAPGEADALHVAVLDARAYGLGGPSAPSVAARIAGAISGAGGAVGAVATLSPLRSLLLRVLPQRGFKLPRIRDARVSRIELDGDSAHLAWRRFGAPPSAPLDPELAATLDGVRTFAREEAALAEGDAAALAAWTALPAAARAHPLAASRILALLCADPRRQPEAGPLAAEWLARDGRFAPALLAAALVAADAGDATEASQRFAALARTSLTRGEVLAALAASDACCALGAGADPTALAAAIDAALAARRSHLPALRALQDLAHRQLDRAALLRAHRGIAAHSPDPVERGRAHARLAVLLAGADAVAARTHLAHAQALAADDAETRDAAARLGAGAGSR